MRKMYFAMIPKRSALEDIAVAASVAVGVVYGAKMLLGDEKFNEYKEKLKSAVFGGGTVAAPAAQGPDTGLAIMDDDLKAKEEESIVERIRRAAKKL